MVIAGAKALLKGIKQDSLPGCFDNISAAANCVDISPGATIAGNCNMENFTWIGADDTVLSNIQTGINARVAAGTVFIKNVAQNKMVAGNAVLIKKHLLPLNF